MYPVYRFLDHFTHIGQGELKSVAAFKSTAAAAAAAIADIAVADTRL